MPDLANTEELFRGADEAIGTDLLEEKIRSGQPLVVKVGFDPTAPDLHLGHSVVLTAMRRLQEAGHKVVFLIGDFTARIGDPTGRDSTRPPLSDRQIAANAATYADQVRGLLDMSRLQIRHNSEWLGAMDSADFIRLTARATVAQMLARDDFKQRYQSRTPISLHEFVYPLAQATDSVVLGADVEMGGTDQKFNMLLGRDLQEQQGMPPQAVITWPLLEGTDGVRKMSKSLDNCIAAADGPEQMFGRLMSISDPLMWRYYQLLSLRSGQEIAQLRSGHPRDAKLALAQELVRRHWDEQEAKRQRGNFISRFSEGKIPDQQTLPVFRIAAKGARRLLANALCDAGLADSASQARRLIRQGAVRLDNEPVQAEDSPLPAVGSYILRAGKRHIIKLEVSE